MRKAPFVAFVAAMALAPAYGQDDMQSAKEWCTASQMKQLDEAAPKLSDAKESAMAAQIEFKKGNIAGCTKDMQTAIDRGLCRSPPPELAKLCRQH